MLYAWTYPSPIGALTAVCDETCLVGLSFSDQEYDRGVFPERKKTKLLCEAEAWLDRYFRGENPPISFPLSPKGTPFQEEVWALLREIPYGSVVTYGELAKALAKKRGGKMSARAVGGAIGKNPIPIFIPCHRVIGAGGKLTGFTGGIDKKIALLKCEGIDADLLALPKK